MTRVHLMLREGQAVRHIRRVEPNEKRGLWTVLSEAPHQWKEQLQFADAVDVDQQLDERGRGPPAEERIVKLTEARRNAFACRSLQRPSMEHVRDL